MTLKEPLFRHLGTTFTEWWLQPPSVRLCVTKCFHDQITCVQFHAYSCRVCALRFVFRNLKFYAIEVYMPTTWHSDDEVEQVHALLDILLDECAHNSILPI